MKLSAVTHSKSGTAMVEAAVIFPLVVLSVIVIIFILAFINRQVSVQTQMHMNLWAERGIVSKTVETGHEKKRRIPGI